MGEASTGVLTMCKRKHLLSPSAPTAPLVFLMNSLLDILFLTWGELRSTERRMREKHITYLLRIGSENHSGLRYLSNQIVINMLSIIIRIMMRATYTESTDIARDGLHWQKRTCLSSLSVCFIIVVLIVINIVVVIVVIMVWKS